MHRCSSPRHVLSQCTASSQGFAQIKGAGVDCLVSSIQKCRGVCLCRVWLCAPLVCVSILLKCTVAIVGGTGIQHSRAPKNVGALVPAWSRSYFSHTNWAYYPPLWIHHQQFSSLAVLRRPTLLYSTFQLQRSWKLCSLLGSSSVSTDLWCIS